VSHLPACGSLTTPRVKTAYDAVHLHGMWSVRSLISACSRHGSAGVVHVCGTWGRIQFGSVSIGSVLIRRGGTRNKWPVVVR
jgi:hypothetical protein